MTKKIKITIEETISQEFEIEVNENEDYVTQIKKKYDNCELVLDNANLTSKQVMIEEDGNETEWMEF